MFYKSIAFAMCIALAPLAAHAQNETQLQGGTAASPDTRASSSLVDATDPAMLAAIIQDLGYMAEIGVDNVGDPMITTEVEGYPTNIFFYGCTDGANCQTLQFSAGFEANGSVSMRDAAEFNRQKRWSNVYIDDEGNPRIEMDVNMYGGVSKLNFEDTFDWWTVVMSSFIEYIDF